MFSAFYYFNKKKSCHDRNFSGQMTEHKNTHVKI